MLLTPALLLRPALSFRLPALHSCAGRAPAALPVDCGARAALLRMSELKVDTYQPSVTPRKAVPSLEDRIAQLHELYEQTGQAMPYWYARTHGAILVQPQLPSYPVPR